MRLSFFPIVTHGLEHHLEDIPSIVDHYVRTNDIRSLAFSAEALQDLQCRDWPGNVRQLQQVIERIALRPPVDGIVKSEHVAHALRSNPRSADDLFRSMARVLLNTVGAKNSEIPDLLEDSRVNLLEELAAAIIQEALVRAGQKNAKAARFIGTNRRVIERFMKRERTSPDPWMPDGKESAERIRDDERETNE
jgi:transcriptional regulator with GAF, ATPase, and Fis domain